MARRGEHVGRSREPLAEQAREPRPDPVDEASIESFPASDPPAWTTTTAGAPDHEGDAPARDAGADGAPRGEAET